MRAWLERLRKICSDLGARAAGGSGRAGDPEGVLQKAGDDTDRPSADAPLAGQSEEPANTPVNRAPAAVEPEMSTELERPGGGSDSAGPGGDLGAVRERGAAGGTGAVRGRNEGTVPVSQIDRKPAQSAPLSLKSLHCTTCFHPDAEAINAKRRKGQTLRSISREHGIPTTSLVRHFKHSGIRSVGGDNAEQVPISENGRNTGTDAPPEGADPLVWELDQLRKVAQGALAHAARTHNLPATASLLRAANGLLDLLARLERRVGANMPTVKVAIAANPEWLSLQAKLLAVLDRHPAARADVLVALRGDVQTVPPSPAPAVGPLGASGATVESRQEDDDLRTVKEARRDRGAH